MVATSPAASNDPRGALLPRQEPPADAFRPGYRPAVRVGTSLCTFTTARTASRGHATHPVHGVRLSAMPYGGPMLSAGSVSVAPVGVQVEERGRLLCLECSGWFIRLGYHVGVKHEISCADYRIKHGLPRGQALEATGLRQRRSERGRQLFEQDPATILARLTPTRTTAEQRVAMSQAARWESAQRPGMRALARAQGAVAGAAVRAASEAELAARAVAAGFTDLHAMLAATSDLPARQVAAMLSVAVRRIWALRRRHGYISTGAGRPPGLTAGQSRQCRQCGGFYRGLGQHIALKHGLSLDAYLALYPADAAELEQTAGDRTTDPRRGPIPPSELATLRSGVQPEDHGRLLCRECGRWFHGLGQHLSVKHGLDAAAYRQRHGLAADLTPTNTANSRRHTARTAPADSKRAQQQRAEQTRRERRTEWEQRAREAGHRDLMALLNKTMDQPAADVAAILQTSVKTIYTLRRELCAGWAPPRLAALPALTAAELAAVPVGTQPERDGRLACLECGQWQRGLGQHSRSVHGLGPAQYRAAHELPAGLRLQAADLRERQAALGQARYEKVRAAMLNATRDPARTAQRAHAAAEVRAESRQRVGGRIAAERAKQVLRELRTAEAAARHAAKARELGYDSMEELIHATAHLPGRQLADLLGMHPNSAYRLRRQIRQTP